ncbi:MAG TPA: regulatory protein RecX [Steroidobacteraceae bacterium]|nr:regulatory protein RecX [Steroidobacteraceae bacterium]
MATPKKPDIPGRREIDPLDARAARAAALDALARRDHPCEELRRKLRLKGYDERIVDELIERLIAEKLLDDRRFLQNFVAYHAARGHGPNRVRADLRKLGLMTPEAESSLDNYPDWTAQLNRARQKKFGTSRPTNYADQVRQAKFLAYRGFTSAQIRAALGFDTDLDADDTTDHS